MTQSKNIGKKGQIMIESLVGITIATVALLGVLALLSQSIGINKDVAGEFIATYLAAEGIEITKNIIDTNCARDRAWNTGIRRGSYEFEYDTIATPGGQLPGFLRISVDPNTRSINPLYYDSVSGLYSYDPGGTPTSFKRTIQIREDPSGLGTGVELGIVSVVEWIARGGGTEEVLMEDHFFDWRSEAECSP